MFQRNLYLSSLPTTKGMEERKKLKKIHCHKKDTYKKIRPRYIEVTW